MSWTERLQLEPLLEASFDIERDILDVGWGPFGRRRILRAKNGTCNFVAQDLKGIQGKIVDGSADYALYSKESDLVTIDVRGAIEIDLKNDGKAYLYVQYINNVVLSRATLDRIGRGETVPFAQSTFIVQPRFEVGVPEGVESQTVEMLQRLVHTRVVAHAQLKPLRVEYRMYEVVNPTAAT
jgi:hypothetical protein